MTCHRVPMSPSLCTCGVVLDITQWHGDNELGDPLCPTCSGCGCEPNERNLMNEHLTPEQLDELRPGTVLRDVNGWDAVKGVNGRWYPTDQGGHDVPGTPPYAVIHPVPEPDHSMCARHDPSLRRAVQEAIGEASVCWDNMSGAGVFDVARANAVADRLCAILDIPEPEPTVVERAAAEIQRADERGDDSYKAMARALADAGLLVRDGEQ